MNIDVIYKIRANPRYYHYLKYHSYFYKDLIRNPDNFKVIEQKMKSEYKMTGEDKLKKLNDNIKLIKAFMDVM